MVRIALDLMGGDHAPASVIDGALLVAQEQPEVELLLVGPPEVAERLLAERQASGRFRVFPASQVVGMDEDPARAIRAKRDASVRVAHRLVRDGEAEAVVSVGSTGAAMAAAVFTLGRLRGMSRPALAAIVPAGAGPIVFLDAGATVEATAVQLVQFALVGAAFARVRLGLADPRVALLSVGEEAGKGDPVRKEAYELLSQAPLRFVGNVEGHDVPLGGKADVVVTDGFTGNVLLKGLEGATRLLTQVLVEVATSSPDVKAAANALLPAFAEATAAAHPDQLGGAVLLGVDGVSVVGHGASSPQAVAACVRVAAQAVREGLVPLLRASLAALVASDTDAPDTAAPDTAAPDPAESGAAS